jgi:hypothetical protein
MTTGLTDISSLNSQYVTALYEDAVFAAREQNLMTRLVRVFTDQSGDQTRSVSTYPTITPAAVGETDDFSAPTSFTKTSLATLTPAEYISQVLLTYRRLATDPQNARQDAALEMGAGFATQIDQHLLSDCASLTGGTVGASGSTMTWAYFFQGVSYMRDNAVPRPWYCVLDPWQWHDLGVASAVSATVTNAPQFQDAVMRQWYVGTVAGVDVFVSGNVHKSTNDAYGAFFNPNAIALDIRRDLMLEPEKDASRRAWELNMTALYAHGVWRPAFGITVVSDATAGG